MSGEEWMDEGGVKVEATSSGGANPRFDLFEVGDEELVARLGQLLDSERQLAADLLCHMAEVDSRKLYAERGYSSMYAYATEGLGLSEAQAYRRIRVARTARRRPELFEDIATGRLTISGIDIMASHLDAAGGSELLDAARGRSSREIRHLVAAARPEPKVPDSISPLDGEWVVVRFAAARSIEEKLEEARGLLSHSVPGGNLADIFERALDALIEKTRKRRFAETPSPTGSRKAGKRSRHIPAEIRREVATRDGGRCQFVGKDGHRCDSSAFVQFHHVDAYGRGNGHSAARMMMLCATHNRLLAEKEYGEEHMAGKLASKRARTDWAIAELDRSPKRVEGTTLPAQQQLSSKRVEVASRPAQQHLSSKRARRQAPSIPQPLHADTMSALTNLGFHAKEATAAVEAAAEALDSSEVAVEKLITLALRYLAPR